MKDILIKQIAQMLELRRASREFLEHIRATTEMLEAIPDEEDFGAMIKDHKLKLVDIISNDAGKLGIRADDDALVSAIQSIIKYYNEAESQFIKQSEGTPNAKEP